MRKKIFCFDIDNVICKTNKSNYKKSKPIPEVINLINKLYMKKHKIKILLQDIWAEIKTTTSKAKILYGNKNFLKNGELNTII